MQKYSELSAHPQIFKSSCIRGISHVLRAMDVPEDYAKGTIRISLGAENTIADVEKIANAIYGILRQS